LVAALLGAGQADAFTQQVQQRSPVVDGEFMCLTVDAQVQRRLGDLGGFARFRIITAGQQLTHSDRTADRDRCADERPPIDAKARVFACLLIIGFVHHSQGRRRSKRRPDPHIERICAQFG